jgi:hypothetical protein
MSATKEKQNTKNDGSPGCTEKVVNDNSDVKGEVEGQMSVARKILLNAVSGAAEAGIMVYFLYALPVRFDSILDYEEVYRQKDIIIVGTRTVYNYVFTYMPHTHFNVILCA